MVLILDFAVHCGKDGRKSGCSFLILFSILQTSATPTSGPMTKSPVGGLLIGSVHVC